jgi:hypothetical protein
VTVALDGAVLGRHRQDLGHADSLGGGGLLCN